MKRFFLILAAVLVLLPLVGGGTALLLARFQRVDASLLAGGPAESWRFLDRKGTLLRDVVNPEGERYLWRGLAELEPLARAVLAVEDAGFRSHLGVEPLALIRAGLSVLDPRPDLSGGSTITMQLARLLWDHPRTAAGKLGQIWDALRLEGSFSKDQILEAYLNLAPFAPGIRGGGTASLVLFGREASRLGPAEAALLAGLLKAPTDLDPRTNPGGAVARRTVVLDAMVRTGVLDMGDRDAAIGEELAVAAGKPKVEAGHFTDWVMAQNPVGGEHFTSLDLDLQRQVEEVVAAHVQSLALEGVGNSAALVLSVPTGEVLAMVGSRNWDEPIEGAVNGTLALRQPGSTLKPFAYELAFESGYTPASILADLETEYLGDDRSLYIPQNYTHSFRGPVTMQEALSASLNVPAVRLVQALGLDSFQTRLGELGFAGLDRKDRDFGLGLVLGNGEVSLLQLAGAYGTLARGGMYLAPRWEYQNAVELPQGTRVMDPMAAWLTTAILSDTWLRGQAFGHASALIFDFPFAVKTGTSNNWRDTWVIGYSKEYVVACWSGNFDASPTNQMSGSQGAGPLFHRLVRLLAERHRGRLTLPQPAQGSRTVSVCAESGMAPTALCPRVATVVLGPGDALEPCTVHRHVDVDLRTRTIAAPGTPVRFVRQGMVAFLPPEYDRWQLAQGRLLPPRSTPEGSDVPALAIAKPRQGEVYLIEPGYDRATQTLALEAHVLDHRSPVDWYLDGKLLARLTWPARMNWPLKAGRHTLELRQGTQRSAIVEFEVR